MYLSVSIETEKSSLIIIFQVSLVFGLPVPLPPGEEPELRAHPSENGHQAGRLPYTILASSLRPGLSPVLASPLMTLLLPHRNQALLWTSASSAALPRRCAWPKGQKAERLVKPCADWQHIQPFHKYACGASAGQKAKWSYFPHLAKMGDTISSGATQATHL